jgi:hypothetical protein
MPGQPPAWRRTRMGSKRAGARLLHRSHVVVFSFVAFERSRQVLVYCNGRHSTAMCNADTPDGVISDVNNGHERKQHPRDFSGKPAHGGTLPQGGRTLRVRRTTRRADPARSAACAGRRPDGCRQPLAKSTCFPGRTLGKDARCVSSAKCDRPSWFHHKTWRSPLPLGCTRIVSICGKLTAIHDIFTKCPLEIAECSSHPAPPCAS